MQPSAQHGLANLTSQIKALRDDGIATLLFDTGDFLQGNPLADMADRLPDTAHHPIADTFNKLQYDAIALGNHDFDYGITALDSVIAQIDCPVLSGNVTPQAGVAHYPATTIIDVTIDQSQAPLKVGILGLTTPTISLTNDQGARALVTDDPTLSAKTAIADLQSNGTDIIIALCHFGIDADDHIENVAADIAGLDGVDAVLAGHTHETFPTGSKRAGKGIDTSNGTVHGTPTVMAGAFGQHLGIIDLALRTTGDKAEVVGHDTRLFTAQSQADPTVFANLRPLHDKTVAYLGDEVAQTALPVSTAFSLIQPDLSQYLLACARQLHMEALLTDTPYASLPLLSTAAPFQTGSRANPNDFINIQPGPIHRSDVAAIYPFNNSAVALLRNGAQIKDWLEDSALLFRPITVGQSSQPLIDQKVPAYRFDTIFGLTYAIDASAPPGHRINGICHKGQPIAGDDQFVLITSTNRLEHGQNIPAADIISIARHSSQDILVQSLQRQSPIVVPCPAVWDFTPLPNTSALFGTAIHADSNATDRDLTDMGVDQNGFRQFLLKFDP
jgi:2',3'-cyclic-nucleotide 2'-phosphodiesterase/3'-nucleotidase